MAPIASTRHSEPPRDGAAFAGPLPFTLDWMPGGEKAPDDAPKPKTDEKKPEAEDPEPDLDEELDESFPASDPPASTQP